MRDVGCNVMISYNLPILPHKFQSTLSPLTSALILTIRVNGGELTVGIVIYLPNIPIENLTMLFLLRSIVQNN